MPGLAKVERFLFESPTWTFLGTLIVLMLVKTGVGAIETVGYSIALAKNPFVNPISATEDQYTMWNWLGSFIAWMIGATRTSSFMALHLAFSASFTALFAWLVLQRFEQRIARVALLLFAMLPVSTTAYYWIGYDSLTLPLMLIAFARPGWWAPALVGGYLVGMEHFEQGLVGGCALLLATSLSLWWDETPTYPIGHVFVFTTATIIGKLTLILIFYFCDIKVIGGRTSWMAEHLPRILHAFFSGSQYIVWSIFGVGWFAALKYAQYATHRIPFFLTMFGLSLLLLVTWDETRVIAIVSFPLILSYWLFDERFLRSISKPEAAIGFLFWALAPWSWVLGGVPMVSAFPRKMLFGG
jgi:hypothetical protein